MKKIVVDLGKCTGCKSCQIICALSLEGELNYDLARIQILKDDKLGLSVAVPCSQCEKAPCVEVCPTDAIALDPKTGANEIDPDKCIGREICLTLAKEGSKLAFSDIMVDEGKELAKEIANIGGKAIFIKTDVSQHKRSAGFCGESQGTLWQGRHPGICCRLWNT